METLNAPLVRQTMETIRAGLHGWDQNSFADRNSCGTTMCFAGHALVLSGASLDRSGCFFGSDGQMLEPEIDGANVLGFSEWQADAVFYFFPAEYDTDDEPIDKRDQFNQMCDRVTDVTGVDCMDLVFDMEAAD